MSDDLTMPTDDAPRQQDLLLLTDLVAVPDDPEDPAEVMVQHEDAAVEDLATEWITVATEDLEDLQERR